MIVLKKVKITYWAPKARKILQKIWILQTSLALLHVSRFKRENEFNFQQLRLPPPIWCSKFLYVFRTDLRNDQNHSQKRWIRWRFSCLKLEICYFSGKQWAMTSQMTSFNRDCFYSYNIYPNQDWWRSDEKQLSYHVPKLKQGSILPDMTSLW